jgi:hypothetical protein
VGRWLKDRLPEGLQQRAKAASASVEALQLSTQDRATAWTYFADDVAELEGLLGKNLSLWT